MNAEVVAIIAEELERHFSTSRSYDIDVICACGWRLPGHLDEASIVVHQAERAAARLGIEPLRNGYGQEVDVYGVRTFRVRALEE